MWNGKTHDEADDAFESSVALCRYVHFVVCASGSMYPWRRESAVTVGRLQCDK